MVVFWVEVCMPKAKSQVLSPEELMAEIKKTKKVIWRTLLTLSDECNGLKSGFPSLEKLEDGNYIPSYFVQDGMLNSIVEKATEIKALGKKLSFLRDLKNKKTL